MIFWKNKWKKEIDRIITREEKSQAKINVQTVKRKKRIFSYSVLSVATAIILTFVLCFTMLKPAPEIPSVVLLEINPAVAFVVDDKGVVTDVSAMNSDADVILGHNGVQEQLIDKKLESAVEIFLDNSLKLGFVDYQGDIIKISSDTDKANKLSDKVQDYFRNSGAMVAVATEKVELISFAERLGLNQVTQDTFRQAVIELPDLFAEKVAQTCNSTLELISQYALNVQQKILDILDDAVDFGQSILDRLNLLSNYIVLDEIDYMLKSEESMEYFYNYREQKFSSVYNANHQTILKEDYQNYIDNLIKNEGSLLEYFNKINNK